MSKCENCQNEGCRFRCTKCKKSYACSYECWNKVKNVHKRVCSKLFEPINGHMDSNKPEKNKITAMGEHTVRSDPDTVTIAFTVTAQYLEAGDTEGAVRSKYKEVIKKRVIEKYPQLVVERTSFSVQPVMEYIKNQRPRRIGFKATQSITFSTQDLGIAGRVIQDATQDDTEEDPKFNPRNEGDAVVLVDGVDFSLKDDDAAEMEALRMATKKARAKIEAMAAAAGVSSWTISRIDEDGYSGSRSIHYESSRALSAVPRSQSETTMTLSPGVIETKKTVRMEAHI